MATDVIEAVLAKAGSGERPTVVETAPNVFKLTYSAEMWAKRISADVDALATLGGVSMESEPVRPDTHAGVNHLGEVLVVKVLPTATKPVPKDQPNSPTKKGA